MHTFLPTWLAFLMASFGAIFVAVARGDAHANGNAGGAVFGAPSGPGKMVLDAKLEKATVTRGKVSYTIDLGTDRATNGDFHVSPDGRSVLFLRKRAFVGRLLDDPRAQGLKPDPLEGLALWRDGKLVATRTWQALLTRQQMFGRSVSHVHWILDADVDWKKQEAVLVTTSFRRYRLDLRDGRFLEESDLPSFTAAPRIAYGVVQGGNDGEELEVLRWDKGTGPGKMQVKREPGSPDIGKDAHWIVPEPVGGTATIREYVDEATAKRRARTTAADAASLASKLFAQLLVGAEAKRAGDDVEFRRGAEAAGVLRLDVREWLPKSQRLYEAVLVVPAELPKEKRDPLMRFLEKGLLYESGRWEEVRVQSDLKGSARAASIKTFDGQLTFRSPSREELVEVRLVANPYAESTVTQDVEGTLKAFLETPAGLGRFRVVRAP